MNKIIVNGRLGSDSELRYTQQQRPVANFPLAIEKRLGKNFEQKTRTIWITVNFWGKAAEGLNKHLRKGRKVTVCGELDEQRWEDKQGNKRSKTIIIAQEIDIHFEKSERNPPNWQDTDDRKEDNFGNRANFNTEDIPF